MDFIHENIYDILECRKQIPKREKKYLNRHDANYVDHGIKVVKHTCATMGQAEYLPPDPSNYLRKHAKSNLTRKPTNKKQCLKQSMLPSLPRPYAKESYKNINYIKQNILSVKTIKPKACEQKLVITRYGDTINGQKLEPKHIYSKKFGTVPNYIHHTSHQIESIKQAKLDQQDMQAKMPSCRYVTRIERESLLNGLKHNWNLLSKKFQLLPVITDSVRRISNKIEAETALNKIEKNILLIEKCPYIYVQN